MTCASKEFVPSGFLHAPRTQRGWIVLFVLLTICSKASPTFSQWHQVGAFQAPIGSGFFFDEQVGLIGSGIRPSTFQNGQIEPGAEIFILRTSDGGATWLQCAVPQMYGAVTQIFMRDQQNGYASIFSDGYLGRPALWRTTDGGATWNQDMQLIGEGTCVYATSKTIIWTDWDNPQYGGNHAWGASISTDRGNTWSTHFRERGNGIDFTDDNIGVVTQMNPTRNTFWYTADGGLSWAQSDANEMEAWSVYGVKGTKTFFTSNESQGGQPHTMVNWSTDGGASWSIRHDFGYPMSFTGTIRGKGSTVYLQTDQGALGNLSYYGLYRSDDLGLTWKPVGGPNNNRDTRFVVTGCSGQVVYAFDDQGNVFKTINGGDGTLTDGNPNDALLSLDRDTIRIHPLQCIDSAVFNLTSLACPILHFDSVTVVGTSELTFSRSNFGKLLHLGDSAKVTIRYAPRDTGSKVVRLLVWTHSSYKVFQKLITVILRSDILEQLVCSKDTLRLSQIGCTSTNDSLTMVANACSGLVIDSVSFSDQSFTLLSAPPFSSASGLGLGFEVSYRCDSNSTHSGKMRIRGHLADHSIDTTIQVLGSTILPKVSLLLDRDTMTYGTKYCTPRTDTLRLYNASCVGVTIDSITSTGPFSTIYPRKTLPPGARDSLWAIFTPTDSGFASGKLVIHAHNYADTLTENVSLRGYNFTTRNSIQLDRTAMQFSTSRCVPVTDSIWLNSQSCLGFTIDSVVSSGSEFKVISALPGVIMGGDTIGVKVLFTPDSGGTRSGNVHIYGKLGGTALDTILKCTATNTTPRAALQLSTDSIKLVTDYCQPITEPFGLTNNLCGEIQLDSVRILGDALNEFSIDTLGFGILRSQFRSGFLVNFRPEQRGTRTALLRLYFHSGFKQYDTTLSISGQNITAPEPYLAQIPSAFAGDTLVVRVMLRPTQDTFSMKHIAFHLAYDTDLLLPLDLFTAGTLATNIKESKVTKTLGGVSVVLDLNKPITQHDDLSLPLVALRMTPYLTKHLSSSVIVDTFATDVTVTEPLCSLPSSDFRLILRCGDTTIYNELANQPLGLEIISIHPNPIHGGEELHLTYKLNQAATGMRAELYDLNGKRVAKFELPESGIGTHSVTLPLSMGSGRFELVLRTTNSGASVIPLLIEH